MSDSSYERVIRPSEEAEQFIKDTGGLPEIVAAAEGLFAAIEQTRGEIEGAVFAEDRFSTELTPDDKNRIEATATKLSPRMQYALEDEGTAGAKREQLTIRLEQVANQVYQTVRNFLELRTDLVVSQQNFDQEPAAEQTAQQ